MVHLVHDDFVSAHFMVEFMTSFIVGVVVVSSVLLAPAIKHLRWKVVYAVKVVYGSCNICVVIASIWWSDWLCGEVKCLEHNTGLSRQLVPTKLSVHMGLDTLHIIYSILNTDITYSIVINHSWNGLIFQQELARYNKKLREELITSPLPVSWLVEQFQSNVSGPQLGFSLQPFFFVAKTALWISATSLVLSFLLFVAGDRISGSCALVVAGLLQLLAVLGFVMMTYRLHRHIFIGYQALYLTYTSLVLWVLPELGLLNILVGAALLIATRRCGALAEHVFKKTEVIFIRDSSCFCPEERRLSTKGPISTTSHILSKIANSRTIRSNHLENSEENTSIISSNYEDSGIASIKTPPSSSSTGRTSSRVFYNKSLDVEEDAEVRIILPEPC